MKVEIAAPDAVAPAMPGRPRYAWEALFFLCCAYFLHQADRALFGVVLPLIKTDLWLTDAELGIVATILFAVLTVFIPFSGPIADRYSRKALIVGSLIFWSIATMLTGQVGGLLGLILLRSIATGGGEALYTPAAYSLVATLHPQRKGLALSLHQGALYLGLIASGVVGGYIGQAYGWRAAFYIFGGIGIVLGGVMAVRLASDKREPVVRKAGEPGVLRAFFTNPIALLLALAFGGVMFLTNAYLVWAPEFLREKFGLSVAVAGALAMFAHHIAALVGVLCGGMVSDKLAALRANGRPLLQAGALLCAIPFVLLMALAPTLVLCCVGLALFGLFRGVYESSTQASLFDVVPPAHRGTAWSLMVMVGFLIGSVSPWLVGVVRTSIGSPAALSQIFAWSASAYVFAVVALLLAARQLGRRAARAQL